MGPARSLPREHGHPAGGGIKAVQFSPATYDDTSTPHNTNSCTTSVPQ